MLFSRIELSSVTFLHKFPRFPFLLDFLSCIYLQNFYPPLYIVKLWRVRFILRAIPSLDYFIDKVKKFYIKKSDNFWINQRRRQRKVDNQQCYKSSKANSIYMLGYTYKRTFLFCDTNEFYKRSIR